MSLHLNRQCQRAQKTDALVNPFVSGRPWRLVFGDRRSEPGGSPRRWSSSRWGNPGRQTLFCNYVALAPEDGRIPRGYKASRSEERRVGKECVVRVDLGGG